MFGSTITTIFAIAIISPTLNGAQERACGIANTARELFWRSLGYQYTQPARQPLSFHELIKKGTYEEIEAAIQKRKATRTPYEHYDPFFDKIDAHGFAPIHYAAQRGDADIVLLLLQSGCSAKQTVRNTNMTPLHLAAQQGHLDAACLLLRGNTDCADVNAQDAIKNTPAHYAFKNGHTELGNYFIKSCGAYPGLLNRERKTAQQCTPSDFPEDN